MNRRMRSYSASTPLSMTSWAKLATITEFVCHSSTPLRMTGNKKPDYLPEILSRTSCTLLFTSFSTSPIFTRSALAEISRGV